MHTELRLYVYNYMRLMKKDKKKTGTIHQSKSLFITSLGRCLMHNNNIEPEVSRLCQIKSYKHTNRSNLKLDTVINRNIKA